VTGSASAGDGPVDGPTGVVVPDRPDRHDRGIVQRVVGWLRAGYPSGVPDQDYVPLLGILRRSLTAEELEQVVDQLVDDATAADAAGEEIGRRQLRERVEELLLGPALPEDLVRVSARLAAAGWPLGSPDDLHEPDADDARATERTGLVSRIVTWLRAGYPAGLPEQDFVPLLALLRRRLSDELGDHGVPRAAVVTHAVREDDERAVRPVDLVGERAVVDGEVRGGHGSPFG
jgi:hypothetical protein